MSNAPDYLGRLRQCEQQMAALRKTLDYFGTLRLALAALIIALAIWRQYSQAFPAVWLLLGVPAFAALVAGNQSIRRRHAVAGRAADFHRRGLARMEDRWQGAGEAGSRFDDPQHVYASDLDLFGPGSLYELLCTVRTRMGEERLAHWLKTPASAEEIAQRHASIDDLRDRLPLREELWVLGDQQGVGVNPAALLGWATAQNRLTASWLPWAAVAVPVLAALAGLYWFLAGSVAAFLIVIIAEAVLLYALRDPISAALDGSETAFQDLRLLSDLLLRLERESFSSPHLQQLTGQLAAYGDQPSQAIASLSVIVSLAGSRRNQLIAALVVPLLYALNVALAAERWRRVHGHAVRGWIDTIGELEALLSLAGYAAEHPQDPFPRLVEGPASFTAVALGHPLIPADRRVSNDVSITADSRILLVSGSNMSGKSTLLRTVGINTVLAMAGAPVRAQDLQLTALQVGASIRINDSLHQGSSRFYAEITRLRQLLDLLKGPRALLFLLDELLQGTNSWDRRAGAEGIVRALAQRGAIGLISTHDLALTEIGALAPGTLRNVHFQDDLQDGRMIFDFRLREGIVTRSNALQLMRSVGLEV